jgi:hypothetical protein
MVANRTRLLGNRKLPLAVRQLHAHVVAVLQQHHQLTEDRAQVGAIEFVNHQYVRVVPVI